MNNITEANSLRNEIERVLPQLRVTIRASDKVTSHFNVLSFKLNF